MTAPTLAEIAAALIKLEAWGREGPREIHSSIDILLAALDAQSAELEALRRVATAAEAHYTMFNDATRIDLHIALDALGALKPRSAT